MAELGQIQNIALQQTLSPQMRQSLSILQAPLAELRQMVQQEIQANPVLEEESISPSDENEESDEDASAEEKDSPLQDEWREWMVQPAGEGRNFQAEERRRYLFESQTVTTTLQEHLLGQLSLSPLSVAQRKIAESIIGNLNDAGFLSLPADEIAFQFHIEPSAVKKVLKEIQNFDPPGVAAMDLRECLLIQLRRKEKEGSLEYRIVDTCLDMLARKKFPDIARRLHVEIADVQEAAESIALLDPRPARNFSTQPDQIVHADMTVEWDGKKWRVNLNEREVPVLRISNTYKDMLSTAGNTAEVRSYLKDKIREGKFFMRCIQQRQETLLRIGNAVMERQQDFLDHGPSHLQPLTMTEIADVIGVHETTVSRAVTGKYISTPYGLFELKFFFASGFNTEEGKSISNKGVHELIADIVANENSRQPLSDQEIVGLLKERGIPVARRTISKYREQMGVLPSHLRRKF